MRTVFSSKSAKYVIGLQQYIENRYIDRPLLSQWLSISVLSVSISVVLRQRKLRTVVARLLAHVSMVENMFCDPHATICGSNNVERYFPAKERCVWRTKHVNHGPIITAVSASLFLTHKMAIKEWCFSHYFALRLAHDNRLLIVSKC